jgi:hypothetical protein
MVPLNSFIDHGTSGWLQQFDGSSADHERLAELLRTPPDKAALMSAAAREAASVHDWDVAVPRFVRHYRDALGVRS